MNNNKYLWTLGVVIILAMFFKQVDTHEDQIVNLVDESLPKTVMLSVVVKEPELVIKFGSVEVYRSTTMVVNRYIGSGVFITPNGHILTCEHLFSERQILSITAKTFDEYEYPAELLVAEERRDLALVKVNTWKYPYATIADPRDLRVGQEAIAIGNPLNLDFSVTHGIISALHRDFSFAYNATQSDTFINPGNSGGPLFNLNGDLIGINSFILSPTKAAAFTGCGFSVQPAQIHEFLVKFKGLEKAVK